tara:strand:- start:3740 stop:5158 length:1419 start_codon:yes stop_codon:yes gene_type:complete
MAHQWWHNPMQQLRDNAQAYLNQPGLIADVANTKFNQIPRQPTTGAVQFGNQMYPYDNTGSTYLGSATPIREDQIKMMTNPNRPSGLAADAALIGGNIAEGVGTGYNIMGKYVTDPFLKYVVDPVASYVAGTPLETPKKFTDADVTFDPVVPGTPGEEVGSLSSFIMNTKKSMKEEEIDRATGKFSDTTLDDRKRQQHYEQRAKDWEEIKDWGKSVWNEFFPDAKDSDKTQENATTIIQGGTGTTSEVAQASAELGKALDSKKDTDMSDADEKQTWQSRVNNGINGFMERLGDPGFQTALAMHMEAKNGGDATDVLFAGVKTTNKLQSAMMQSQINELKMTKLILDMQKTQAGLMEPMEVTESMEGIISSLLAPYGAMRENVRAGAMAAISSRAMEYVKDGMSETDAAKRAFDDAKGGLTPDKWLDQFVGWGGPEWDVTKMLPSGVTKVNTQAEFDNATGLVLLPDGRTIMK